MKIEGLGNFSKYDIENDGKISLRDFRSNKKEFTRDFILAPISKKLFILSATNDKAKKELLAGLKKKSGPPFSAMNGMRVRHSIIAVKGEYLRCDWLANRITQTIEFALKEKSADEISLRDFFHGHILIPRRWVHHFKGVKTRQQLITLFKRRPPMLLYHTQEFTGKYMKPDEYRRRNIVQFSDSTVPTFADKQPNHNYEQNHEQFAPTVYADDLDAMVVGQVVFELDPDGKYVFEYNGQVHRYSAFMTLDISSLR